MDNLTMNQIKAIVKKHIRDEARGKINRERYRKTEKGKTRHNISSKKTYYRKKINNLNNLDSLTDKQDKQLKKWSETLQTLENGIKYQNTSSSSLLQSY